MDNQITVNENDANATDLFETPAYLRRTDRYTLRSAAGRLFTAPASRLIDHLRDLFNHTNRAEAQDCRRNYGRSQARKAHYQRYAK